MKHSFFGKPKELPKPVSEDEITKPSFEPEPIGEQTDYEEVGDEPEVDPLDEMLGHVPEDLQQEEEAIEAQEKEAAANKEDPPAEAVPASDVKAEQELNAELVLVAFEGARHLIYSFLYSRTVSGSDLKTIRRITRQLSMKNNRSAAEQELLEQLWGYLEKHEQMRHDFLDRLAWKDKQRETLAKLVELELRKRALRGQANITKWAVIGSLLINEANAVGSLVEARMTKPDLDTIDWSVVRKAGIEV